MNDMNELEQLKQRVAILEKILMISDKYLFQKPLVGGPNGLRLGSMAKDKIGFYDVAPVAKYVTIHLNAPAGATYGGNEQAMLNAFRDGLVAYGLFET
jgi:hypothetical protein